MPMNTTTPLPTSHLLFCDEFGNTGPRLFDPAQPLFLYAFLVISQATLLEAADRVALLYEQERIALTELKSAKLWGSARGLRRYTAIGELLARLDARLCISLVEKRYQACSMITETYLDPAYNEYAPPEMANFRHRQAFADAAYEWLTDELISEFLAAVHKDDSTLISAVGNRIAGKLRFHPNNVVSHAADRMETRPGRIFRYGERRANAPTNFHLPASQQATFGPGLAKVDAYLDSMGITALMMRDEDRQFGGTLDFTFSLASHLDEIPEPKNYGITQGLRNVLECSDALSREEFGLQLADLAAGLIGRVAEAALRGRALEPLQLCVLEAWRPTLLPVHQHFWMVADSSVRIPEKIFGQPRNEWQ